MKTYIVSYQELGVSRIDTLSFKVYYDAVYFMMRHKIHCQFIHFKAVS